jgi:hypothetical protein
VVENRDVHTFRMDATESACLYWSSRYSGFECLMGRGLRCFVARMLARKLDVPERSTSVRRVQLATEFDISSRSMGWLLVLRNCEYILFLPSVASNQVCFLSRTDCIPWGAFALERPRPRDTPKTWAKWARASIQNLWEKQELGSQCGTGNIRYGL